MNQNITNNSLKLQWKVNVLFSKQVIKKEVSFKKGTQTELETVYKNEKMRERECVDGRKEWKE